MTRPGKVLVVPAAARNEKVAPSLTPLCREILLLQSKVQKDQEITINLFT